MYGTRFRLYLGRMSISLVPDRHGRDRPLTEVVAEEVRALMARRGVTQMQLVQVLNVSQTGVSKRLRGVIPFDANEIGVMADYFNVSVGALFGAPTSSGPGPEGGSGIDATRE